jgi:hypothetical protein
MLYSMRSMARAGLGLVCLLGCSPCLGITGQGRTLTAASLLQPDVQRAVDAAADGDTVKLPAGTATWTTGVTVADKFISIVGSGIDETTIVAGEYAPSAIHPTHRVFTISAKRGGLTRLTRLTIEGGTGARDDYNKGMVAIGGDSTTWRIDHLRIRATRTCAMHVYSGGGVIDHCRFELVGWIFGIYGFNGGGSYGDDAWAETAELGSGNKAFFVEDNVFTATDRSFALDGWAGERVVFRHNTLRNTMIGNHGTESSGRLRGARSFEIYENTIALSGPTYYSAIELRSGTGVIFNNAISGDVSEALRVDNYRDFGSFSPWGIASGESPFDKNDVDRNGKPIVYEAGTHTGGNGVQILSCSGKRWTPGQWQGYSVHNTATGKSSIIVSNTGDTIVARFDDTHGGPNLLWHTGDGFKIERCLVALDQMGRGKGTRITGDTPQPTAWPEQVREPTYIWNNTLNGVIRGLVSGSPHIKEDIDFFNGRPKPSYTPFTYPHPLAKL